MAQAAHRHGLEPRSISFIATVQTLAAFQPLIAYRAPHHAAERFPLYQHLLDAIATQRLADRPDRYEPRLKKHRRNHYGRLTRTRAEVKRIMARGVATI